MKENITRSARRWRTLKEAGKCTRCQKKNDNGMTKCNDCLSRERRRRAGFALPPEAESPFCADPLCDVLDRLDLNVTYWPDRYEFSGATSFVWTKRPGDTPFDALRAKQLIK